jgi:hypothetical protein
LPPENDETNDETKDETDENSLVTKVNIPYYTQTTAEMIAWVR